MPWSEKPKDPPWVLGCKPISIASLLLIRDCPCLGWQGTRMMKYRFRTKVMIHYNRVIIEGC
jgi:hypothetical protein